MSTHFWFCAIFNNRNFFLPGAFDMMWFLVTWKLLLEFVWSYSSLRCTVLPWTVWTASGNFARCQTIDRSYSVPLRVGIIFQNSSQAQETRKSAEQAWFLPGAEQIGSIRQCNQILLRSPIITWLFCFSSVLADRITACRIFRRSGFFRREIEIRAIVPFFDHRGPSRTDCLFEITDRVWASICSYIFSELFPDRDCVYCRSIHQEMRSEDSGGSKCKLLEKAPEGDDRNSSFTDDSDSFPFIWFECFSF